MIAQCIIAGLSGALLAAVLLYARYWRRKFRYWADLGVPHLTGHFPFGSDRVLREASEFGGAILQRMYEKMSGVPYFGIYEGVQPTLVLRDPDAIKTVLAKEFSHFRDRLTFRPHPGDVLARHLFLLKGEEWRALRVKMSPVFTTGRMKAMFPLFLKCAEALEELLLSKLESEVSVKDLTERYSLDVICSCAFGLEVGSLKNEDSVFRKLGSQGDLKQGWGKVLRNFLATYLPFISHKRTDRITPQSLEDFMVRTVRETVEHREKTGLKRNDFIDLLIQLRDKGDLAEGLLQEDSQPVVMSMELMTAQCFVFFQAGHGTSSSVKSFCLYELALHQEIQDRLHREICDVIERHGGITYQAVQDMDYLDMVINETVRKYPTLMHLERHCTEDFTFPDGGRVERGTRVLIPVWALHHDPALYPDPQEFRPDRFAKDNPRHPFAFIPFGEGPRICIGMRFGLLQTKMGIITFLRRFKVQPTGKTEVPLRFREGNSPLTDPLKPIVLKLTSRDSH